MKQQHFEQQHDAFWQAFLKQLDHLERPGKQRTSAANPAPDHRNFADHYRKLCHHLALAQERQYSPTLIDRLNHLALRGHEQLYQRHSHLVHNALVFMAYGFPQAIRKEVRLVLISSLLFFGPLLIMGIATYFDPSLIYTVYPHDHVQEFTLMYQPDAKTLSDYSRESGDDWYMFGYYIRNNIGIGFQTFASGILLGIGTLFNLLFNGVAIGGVAGYLTQLGYLNTFYPFVIGHGAFELTGIAIAGAAGLKLGYGVLHPGQYSRRHALLIAARDAIPLVYGVFLMLLIAAFIEAFWSSSSVVTPLIKLIVGVALWCLVLGYFFLGARRGSE